MKYRFLFISLTLLIFSSTVCIAQKKESYAQKIDSLIKGSAPRPFNGVILVTEKGKIKYTTAMGYANFESKVRLKLDDQFEIMSNSKQITAALILKEVEKGNIELHKPIRTYLSYLTQSWADSVTVHQLLNHTHGIVDVEKPLVFKAGSDFKYGNLACILLGRIIEFSSKKKYSEVAEELFQKLQMKNTFCYSKGNNRRLVSGHTNEENHFAVLTDSFVNEENLPADGIITTAEDLSIWNKNLHHGKVLKPESYKLMTTISVMSQHDVFGKEKMGYGYNIRVVEENGVKYLGHTGLGDGFASLNVYFPESDVSLIVLENQMSEDNRLYYYYETLIKNILVNSNLVKKH